MLIKENEVKPDTNWPNWAKDQHQKLFVEYKALEAECDHLLDILPVNRKGVLAFDLEKLTPVKKKLEEFQKIDALLEKIDEDVVLFDTKVAGAITQVNEQLKTLTGECQIAEINDYGTTTWKRKLAEIAHDVKSMVVTDRDSHRTLFLAAYDKKQMLESINESMQAERLAKNTVSEQLPQLEGQMIHSIFQSKAAYASDLDFLFSKYSGSSIAGLIALRLLEGQSETAQIALGRIKEILASKDDRKFRSALSVVKETMNAIAEAYTAPKLAKQRIAELRQKEAEFPTAYENAEKLALKALEDIKDSDVRTQTQEMARNAMKELKRAKVAAELKKPDWIKAFVELELASTTAENASSQARADISAANARRRAAKEAAEQAAARAAERSYTPTPSFDFNPSPSSGGSSFGGFGGGDFGGGGGGTDW